MLLLPPYFFLIAGFGPFFIYLRPIVILIPQIEPFLSPFISVFIFTSRGHDGAGILPFPFLDSGVHRF